MANYYKCLSGTVTTTAVKTLMSLGASDAEKNKARRLVITAGANPVRWTLDGTDPTSTIGHYLAANGTVTLDAPDDLANIKLLAVGGDSVVTVSLSLHRMTAGNS